MNQCGVVGPVLVMLAVVLQVPGHAQPGPVETTRREALLSAARAIMEATRYCTVVTVDETGRADARVVDPFAPDADMVVWFATNPDSRKVAQIRRDPRVTLHYFDPATPAAGYVTILGRARLVDDPAEKQRRWKEGWDAFWPDRDRSYLLVEVTPERLEVVSTARKIEGDPKTWLPPSVTFPPRP